MVRFHTIPFLAIAARQIYPNRFFRKTNALAGFFALCALFGVNHYALAEEPKVDKFKIALGGYTLARNESNVSLTARDIGAGISISPEETLGIHSEQTVFRIDGYYRYGNEHSITYSWYSISSDGHKSMEEEFEWVDENGDPVTIPVGAQVNTTVDYDIFKLGYLWSFHHTDKVELAAGVGVHLTRIAIGLEAETTSTGVGARDVKTSIPLPVLSFSLNYNVTPKFSWYLKTEAFAMEFDEWSGIYTDSGLGVEYRVAQNLGLGVGFGTNALEVSESTSEYDFTYSNRISGISLYVAGYF